MTGQSSGSGSGNRTVFRPSPLQGLHRLGGQKAPSQGWGAVEPASQVTLAPFSAPPLQGQPAAPPPAPRDDDIPRLQAPETVRNRLMAYAAPILTLAASMRSGRVRSPLPELHRQSLAAIDAFDRAIAGHYPQNTCIDAKYALCATMDDIVQNLPGIAADVREWARRSMTANLFREQSGGDRFWRSADEAMAHPRQHADLIELYHACLAAGFEERYRAMADGKLRHREYMDRLLAALEYPRRAPSAELVGNWKGEIAPLHKVGIRGQTLLAATIAAALLLLVYIVLQSSLISSEMASSDAVARLNPDAPLRLSRVAPPPAEAPPSGQAAALKAFLDPEIRAGLVVIEEDAQTVRIRTTVGQLFRSGSDQLEPGQQPLFERIGAAVKTQAGPVSVEGHADSDHVSTLSFPDNMALSRARAETVAKIIAGQLDDPARVSATGFGDSRPIASNDTDDGKSLNRRVEIVVRRRN